MYFPNYSLIVSMSWWHHTHPLYIHTCFMIQVRGDDKDDPTTYLVTFDKEEGAKYLVIGFVHSVLHLVSENDLHLVSENDSFDTSVTYAIIFLFFSLFLLS